MNVFVLCTGRCGSVTFIEAARRLTNYSAAHESRCGLIGADRLAYPKNHIEADNRLSWFLGRLEQAYGDDAFYVHLRRDDAETAESFVRRYHNPGIMLAYRKAVLWGAPDYEPAAVALDLVRTINANIESFLRNKTKKMTFRLENAEEDFRKFWELIGGQGSLPDALAQWKVKHNPSREPAGGLNLPGLPGKIGRVLRQLPQFLRDA